MNRFTTRTGPALVAAAAMAALAACGGGDSGGGGGSQSATDTLTFALRRGRRAHRLRPAALLAGPVHVLQRAVRRPVRDRRPTARSSPAWSPSSSNNADNTQTTLTLRDGVTFADGSTLDSTLVKANLDRRSDETLEAYGALAPGGASEITDVAGAGPADRRHHLGAAAGEPGEQPRRHRRRHRRPRRRRGPRLPGDDPGRLGRLHAERGRDHAGQHLHAGQERRGVERRRVVLRLHRLQRHHRPAGAGQRRRLRPGRRRHDPRRADASSWSSRGRAR